MTPQTTNSATPPVTTQNRGSSEQDVTIQEAEAKVREAETLDRRATITMRVFSVLYVVVTALVVWSSLWSNQKSGELRSAEKLLNDLQKEKIRADALLKTEVETQKVREGAARELKIKVEQARGDADAKIEHARGEAATKVLEVKVEAARQIGEVQKEVAKQQERAAKAETDLEQEKLVRLDLEQTLAPRWINITLESGTPNFETLTPFPGQQVVVEFLTDPEAHRAAHSVTSILQSSHWNVVRVDPNPDIWPSFWDGVVIQTFPVLSPNMSPIERFLARPSTKTDEAAKTLLKFLESYGWRARIHVTPDHDITEGKMPNDSIRVRVGFKPAPHFMEEWQRDPEKWLEKEREKYRQKRKAREGAAKPGPSA